jgi:two-component system nitrogen regulation response regulator NtrX
MVTRLPNNSLSQDLEILVIDDESDIRDLASDILKDEGFIPRLAANSSQAFKILNERTPSAILLDIWLHGSELDGLGILEIVKKRYPLMPVIVISGHGTIETAVSAIKLGAYDYLEKPFNHDKLIILLKRACETAKLKRENIDLKAKVLDKTEIIGNASVISKLKSEINKLSQTNTRILIEGAIGTGKELVARMVHKQSKRANAPFILFNPICMSAEKILQEMFGPFEQDGIKRLSSLEIANNGTFYIDEISNLPMIVQSKLLKFLQDQVFEQVSGKKVKLDIRFVAATAKNIREEIEEGRFLNDLYYRLNVTNIKTPSLSERKDDIPILIKYLIKQISRFWGFKEREFAEDTITLLQSYDWPGNIRQLRNVIEWIMIMNPAFSNDDLIIKPNMIPSGILTNTTATPQFSNILDMLSLPLREAREVFERQYLLAQLNRFNFNISKTAEFVGMERSALHRKLKLLNLNFNNKNNHEDINDEDFEDHKL